MDYNKLSADPASLVLGICSVVIGIAGCCCYGFLAIIPLILGIIGLVMANRSIREFEANPEIYSKQSRGNVTAGKVLSIIGVVFNSLLVLLSVVVLAFYGTIISTAVFEGIKNGEFENETYEDYDTEENLEITEEDVYQVEEEDFQKDKDSLNTKLDTIN